jgi:DNA (cytosine-5)-methyltransferase 1
MDVAITSIGQNKGAARIWLQGNTLLRNGFEPGVKYKRVAKEGAIVITKVDDTVVLTQLAAGEKIREVSGRKKNDTQIPIIDINNNEVAAMFEGLTRVKAVFLQDKIVIVPLASEIRAKARLDRAKARIAAGQPLKVGSFAHGGGVLSHALEEGLSQAGVPAKLMLANEYRDDLIDHVIERNSVWSPQTIGLCGPMQEYAYDANVLQMVSTHLGDDGELDLIEAGIPCSGASVAGRAKRGLVHAEAHPEVGHLVAPFISLIARFNPSVVVLENVPQYLNTASMDILRNSLRDLCYDVHETVINGGDWNSMEHRERMVMVGVTKGMSFNFDALKRPVRVERELGEILEDIPLDHPSWSEMTGLKAKEKRDKEAGKSFAMQIFDRHSKKINTLTKGIGKNRSTDPKIRHPENPDLLRIPTPIEHARAKDIPEELIEGASATMSHELLGQSINYKPFVSVGQLVGETYKLLGKPSHEAEFKAQMLTDAVLARARQMARMKMH